MRDPKKIWIWIWPSYWTMRTRPTLQRQKKKSSLFCNQKIIMEAICILWHRRLVLHQNLLKLGWRGRGQRRLMMKSWGGVKVTIMTKLKIMQKYHPLCMFKSHFSIFTITSSFISTLPNLSFSLFYPHVVFSWTCTRFFFYLRPLRIRP